MADIENMEIIIQMLRANKCVNSKLDEDMLLDDLEMDSIHMAGFLLDMEERFRLYVPDEEFKRWIKLGDIADYVDKFMEEYGSGDLREM
jgi:acyl carrier protein